MDIDSLVKLAGLLDNQPKMAHTSDENHGLCVIVLDKGFVFVGNLTTDDKWASIENAQPIIRWGTTGGLTELANKGPRENTKLGATQETVNKSPIASLINIIPCNSSNWK